MTKLVSLSHRENITLANIINYDATYPLLPSSFQQQMRKDTTLAF